jgi:hypothetical protein
MPDTHAKRNRASSILGDRSLSTWAYPLLSMTLRKMLRSLRERLDDVLRPEVLEVPLRLIAWLVIFAVESMKGYGPEFTGPWSAGDVDPLGKRPTVGGGYRR